ncbi:hypothetical protein BDZ45DRAFT_750567 [Acephala macrosclerotiorum]|nr:hypothetical protein BDZ45DRAFT_750567 [Acephala macrosclerotiorum]
MSGTSPSNPTDGDVSALNVSFTSGGNSDRVLNSSNAKDSNHKRRTDQDDDEDDETNKKRQRRDPPGSDPLSEKVQRLTCPYRLRGPGSFGLNGTRVCSNTWPDIAKLK